MEFHENFMKIRPMGAELFHADKHDKANSRVSKFCERPQQFCGVSYVSVNRDFCPLRH